MPSSVSIRGRQPSPIQRPEGPSGLPTSGPVAIATGNSNQDGQISASSLKLYTEGKGTEPEDGVFWENREQSVSKRPTHPHGRGGVGKGGGRVVVLLLTHAFFHHIFHEPGPGLALEKQHKQHGVPALGVFPVCWGDRQVHPQGPSDSGEHGRDTQPSSRGRTREECLCVAMSGEDPMRGDSTSRPTG